MTTIPLPCLVVFTWDHTTEPLIEHLLSARCQQVSLPAGQCCLLMLFLITEGSVSSEEGYQPTASGPHGNRTVCLLPYHLQEVSDYYDIW